MENERIVLIFAAIISLLTLAPVIYGYASGDHFMGLVTGISDSNTYFDYMNQVGEGHFLFRNSYTSEAMPPLLIRPLYFIMGLFSIFLPAIVVWHLFRVALAFVFLVATYRFTGLFMKKGRMLAFFTVAVGSGLGYFSIFLNRLLGTSLIPVDLWLTEAIPFLTINGPPHFILSLILMMGVFYFYLKKRYVLAGLCGFILGFEHIYDMVVLYIVLGMYALHRKEIRGLMKFYAVSSPSALYYFALFMFHPVYSVWRTQNVLLSPAPQNYIFGFGLPLVFALVGLRYWKRYKLISLWLVVNLALLYIPLSFQRRLVEGIWLPMSMMASVALTRMRWKKVAVAFMILIPMTNIFVFTTYFDYTYSPSRFSAPYYLTEDQHDMLSWIDSNLDHDKVILADPALSNYIPRVTGNRVYVGHWTQTIDYEEKVNHGPEESDADYYVAEDADYDAVYKNEGLRLYKI